MNWLKKLFGVRATAAATAAAVSLGANSKAEEPKVSDPANNPNLIRIFDAYGREMFITKQEWRDKILLDHIKKEWNNPDALYATIAQSLEDGFAADMVAPAIQLRKIDPNSERGAITLAVVYLQLKRYDDAEKILTDHIQKHGEAGITLTNLAKVYAGRGQSEQAQRTLWHALEIDPNQDNGLGWYTAIFREKDGDSGFIAALQRIATLPGSWRARLWLARDALNRKQVESALKLYEEALAFAPKPVPFDLLQQMSGDLGNHAYLIEALRLTVPHYQPQVHGLAVGNNLIKANLDLGQLDAAHALVQQLYALKRMDWKQTLSYWDAEIAKARASIATPVKPEKLDVTLLSGQGPIWLSENSLAAELFPTHQASAPLIAFIGSSAEMPREDDKPRHQVTDGPGRLCRALPLFLAEQATLGTQAKVRVLTPWLRGEHSAFIVGGQPWSAEAASEQARSGETPADYVVVTHIKALGERWTAELRLVRTIDGKVLDQSATTFSPTLSEDSLTALSQQLLSMLAKHADIQPTEFPPSYRVPSGPSFTQYLVSLEQLLAVRSAAQDKVSSDFLSGERDILDGGLRLCVDNPNNVVARLLFAETMKAMKEVRPQIVSEYRDKVQLLQREKPVAEPTHRVLQQTLTEVFR